ncbi:hypothetical protein C0J52_00066 [Blattella germanica]|nr:hypothetical protein C0J52_00066 [Blattella germanica]
MRRRRDCDRGMQSHTLALEKGEPQVNVVALRSHDFTGLGFNICGNMRDGIFVKDVLHRGPASESGQITPGDRIDSIRISFRHMVFEDALTILSYASPYDVQLEVENASNSHPSTLIRTKRTSAPADRICHPFYRSQSIADLAQACLYFFSQFLVPSAAQELLLLIGKASLKRMQQLGGMNKSPQHDESGDYPTLKLSTSPTGEGRKETARMEKTAPTAIVKPERAKRSPTKASPGLGGRESPTEEGSKDSMNRFQKFGVRVLPDPSTTPRNSRPPSEDVGDRPMPQQSPKRTAIEAEKRQNEHNTIIEGGAISSSEVDGSRAKNASFPYDERGIDIGPIEQTRPISPIAPRAEDAHAESNVKNLLSKGLQNLKDKLHHHEKKKSSSNSDSSGGSEKDEPSNPHSEMPESEQQMEEKVNKADNDNMEGQIPTEIPEEVRRAAMAARSNRKSSGNLIAAETPPRKRTTSQDASSSDGDDQNLAGQDADSLDRTPKRPNKRKAPPPPPEEGDEKFLSEGPSSTLEAQKDVEEAIDKPILVEHMLKKQEMPNVEEDDTVGQSKQNNNPESVQKDVTNITIEDISSKATSKTPEELTMQDEQRPKAPHMDYDIGVNVSSMNSDSDSDIDRLEGDDDSYDGRKTKKGGTTIELNSSHITIHHSPSSETVQLENESTRKAASLGDLSRLDSEQPMSVLERAVSLDLADGGTPHGSKKRKAPLPPPGEDYLGMPDGDDGIAHRKEPRLDSAMDTFQRRRLKKSSDWGTLEEALMQSQDSAVSVLKSDSEETGISRSDDVSYSSLLSYSTSGPNSLDQAEVDSSQKTVLRITPEPGSSSHVTITPSTFKPAAEDVLSSSSSPQHSISMTGLVSSTPISHSISNGGDALQSPIVTSSHSGISNVHVVSSTTSDEPESSLAEPYITAVDSTTTTTIAGDLSPRADDDDGDDATWGQDSQPPELPTSPVPVLSSFKPSPSMTYITEIQVVTSADNATAPESTSEDQSSTVAQRVLKFNMESSSPPEPENKEPEAPQKGNVSVTAIRNTASRIPMRITTNRVQTSIPPVHISGNSLNHITATEERRGKPARPPVPPRKSEGTSGESRIHNRIPEAIHISPTAGTSGGKFISFSSLTPTSTENGATRNSSSFEQWVFLDETNTPNTPNGLEGVRPLDDGAHSMVMSLPARTQSITHIVLDSKQANGNHGKP